MLELFIGQIPEAIFMALFMIYTKNIKIKRGVFIIAMIIEYILLIHTFPYTWLFHITYMVLVYILLKVLYKKASQITDLFIFVLGYAIIIITSVLCLAICRGNVVLACVMNRLLIFIPLFIWNYKLNVIQNIYKKYWNRNRKPKKMKSLTFRCVNVVGFNLLFVIINIGMIVATCYNILIK